MSLKRMVMGIAIGLAAREGIKAVRRSGGLSGIKQSLTGGGSGGGLGSLLRGGSSGGMGGGLGGLLSGGAAAGGGLLGGLATMAGGSAMANDGTTDMRRAEAVDHGIDDEALAGLMLRAMAQAVRADGQIDAEEEAALMEVMAEGDPGDTEALNAALNEPVDAAGLAAQVPPGQGAQVYAAALTVIDPDHPAELAYLDTLVDGLDLSSSDRRQLHAAQGKPL